MEGFMVLLRKEILESWRTYKFIIIGGITIFFAIVNVVTIIYLPELMEMAGMDVAMDATAAASMGSWIANLVMLAVFVPPFIVMGVVAKELSDGITASTLVRPVGRWAYILPKFLVYTVIFLLWAIVSTIICYLITNFAIEEYSFATTMQTLGLCLPTFVFAVALGIFFSSLFKSQVASAGATIGVLFLMYILSILPIVKHAIPLNVGNWSVSIINGDSETSWLALILCFVGAAALVCGAVINLKKKEI